MILSGELKEALLSTLTGRFFFFFFFLFLLSSSPFPVKNLKKMPLSGLFGSSALALGEVGSAAFGLVAMESSILRRISALISSMSSLGGELS